MKNCSGPLFIASILSAFVPGILLAADRGVRAADDLATILSRARSGDRVVLQRGGIWPCVDLQVPPGVVLIAAPGRGESPVITGAVPLRAWKPEAGKPGRFTAQTDTALACFDERGWFSRARYPNGGWLRTAKGTTGDRIVAPELLKSRLRGNWSGAALRWRRWSWFYEIRKVASDDGRGTLALAPRDFKAPNNVGIGSGFYLEAAHALDAPREYWHDGGKLVLISEDKRAPKDNMVWAIRSEKGLKLGKGSGLVGVTVRGYGGNAVVVTHGAVIRDCRFEHIIGTAITGVWDAAGTSVENNAFTEVLTNAITWNENPAGPGGTVIRNNTFTEIGTRAGWGSSGTWKCCGVIVSNGCKNPDRSVLITGNRFDRIGYAGVILGSDNQRVERNLFRRCMATHNDGAAVYTNSNGNLIKENVILDTIGDLQSSHPWCPLGHGIWPEFLKEFRDHRITGNTVFGSGGNGIFLPNNRTATIADNVLVSNRLAALALGGHEKGKNENQDHKITGNLFAVGGVPYAKPAGEQRSDWNRYSDTTKLLSFKPGIHFGRMSDNIFIVPQKSIPLLTLENKPQVFNTWGKLPWADHKAQSMVARILILINDSDQEAAVALPAGSWRTLKGARVARAVNVPPWRSVPVVAVGGWSRSTPGYLLFSEQNKKAPK